MANRQECAICFSLKNEETAVPESERSPLCEFHERSLAAAGLREIIEGLEAIDWTAVEDMSVVEAAKLQERLREVRQATIPPERRPPAKRGETA